MNSTGQEKIADCVRGLYFWFLWRVQGSIDAPPSDLLNEVVNRVLTRRQPGLDSVMSCLSAILKDLPQLFTENQLEDICIALQYLEKDTELPNQLERDRLDGVNLVIAVSDRPAYRKRAAEIAYRLHQLYNQITDKVMPDILITWKDICQNSTLPEVRRVWK